MQEQKTGKNTVTVIIDEQTNDLIDSIVGPEACRHSIVRSGPAEWSAS